MTSRSSEPFISRLWHRLHIFAKIFIGKARIPKKCSGVKAKCHFQGPSSWGKCLSNIAKLCYERLGNFIACSVSCVCLSSWNEMQFKCKFLLLVNWLQQGMATDSHLCENGLHNLLWLWWFCFTNRAKHNVQDRSFCSKNGGMWSKLS